MAYYIRILGIQNPDIHLDTIANLLEEEGLEAQLAITADDTPDKWTVLQIANAEGDTLVQIERDEVAGDGLGQEELEEFRVDVNDYQPASARQWLQIYFGKVKVIYAFQMLEAAFEDDNYEIVNCVRMAIWNATGGILQADNEGYSNEDGNHILWQFDDSVSGEWACAVLNQSGTWDSFIMELSDPTQRKEFLEGKVPGGARQS